MKSQKVNFLKQKGVFQRMGVISRDLSQITFNNLEYLLQNTKIIEFILYLKFGSIFIENRKI